MDLFQSLILPQRQTIDLPSDEEIRRQQEEAMALLAVPDPPTNHHIDQEAAQESATNNTEQQNVEPLYTTMSLEEFQKDEAEKADIARRADIDARIVSHASSYPQNNSSATRALQDKSTNTVLNGTLRGFRKPLALGKPRTSDHIIALHQLINKHKLPLPEYEYIENGVTGAGTFAVRLRLAVPILVSGAGAVADAAPVVVLEDDGPFRSKKEAKEVISEKGVVVLKEKAEEVEKAQKILHETKSPEDPMVLDQEESTAPVVPQALKPAPVPGENPIGLLLEFCSAESLPQPSYQLYQLNVQTFACELEVQLPPDSSFHEAGSEAEGHPPPIESRTGVEDDEEPPNKILMFGSQTQAYTSKKAAKTASATAAIAYLREHEHLARPGSSPLRKRQRQSADGPAGMSVTHTDLSNGSDLDPAALTTSAIPNLADPDPSTQAQMNRLRMQLGLGNVEYRLLQTAGMAYYTGYAVFPDSGRNAKAGFGGPLSGKVGVLTEEVFGKKGAKEAIARAVVGLLRDEVERRGGDIGVVG